MPYTATISMALPVAREATGPGLATPTDVAAHCSDMRGLGNEIFVVFTLTQRNAVIDRHVISVGSLTESIVHPRDVFRVAIADNAAAIVLAHNHPSGDPTPSRADRTLTQRMSEAADLLGFRLLDHLIIGSTTWGSVITGERGELLFSAFTQTMPA